MCTGSAGAETHRKALAGIIDTHSHLQAPELDAVRPQLLSEARAAGVESMLLCAASPEDWERTLAIARRYGLGCMIGIHPLWLSQAEESDLKRLRSLAEHLLEDPVFIGIGECGLDGIVPGADSALAEAFFFEQLKIARDLDLPLSIHVRKTSSRTLGALRRVYGAPGRSGFRLVRGAVHAFSGSDAERDAFLRFGLRLGFGGAVTYAGSRRIRRQLSEVPDGSWVLETDAPDMPSSARRSLAEAHGTFPRTEPADILETVDTAAALRGIERSEAVRRARLAALAAFPRLGRLIESPAAFARRAGF